MEECEVIDPRVKEKETIISRAAVRDMEEEPVESVEQWRSTTVGLALMEDEEQDEKEDQ